MNEIGTPPAISRRTLLKAGSGAALLATVGSGCSSLTSSPSGGSGHLTIQTYPDPYPDVIKRFAVPAVSGVKVTLSEQGNSDLYPRLEAAAKNPPPAVAGGMWNDSWAARGAQDDMWLPLEKKYIPNLGHVIPELRQPENLGATFGVTPFGIAYNPEYVDAPTSWADLYNPDYRGKVALWDVFFDWLIMAARLEGGDEKNLDPGIAAWKKAKANIGFWANSLPVLHEAIHRGEVWLAADWGSWALSAKAAGKSVDFAFPDEGATQASSIAEVHRGISKSASRSAQELFNEYLSPEFQLEQVRKSFYSPTISGVEIPADIVGPGLVTAEEAASKLIRYDYGYVGAHFSDINETITRELK